MNHKKATIHDFAENPGCGSVIYAFMLFFVVVVDDVLIFVPKSDNSSTGCVYFHMGTIISEQPHAVDFRISDDVYLLEEKSNNTQQDSCYS